MNQFLLYNSYIIGSFVNKNYHYGFLKLCHQKTNKQTNKTKKERKKERNVDLFDFFFLLVGYILDIYV